jgi:surface polysaccharide O-acyltransferase-like enzyme
LAPPEQLHWVSWLKVFAICGVVTIHATGATAVRPDARSTVVGVMAIVLNRGFNFTVPLFVMLSGALLLDPARYRGDADFLRRRALRLVPAVIFWHFFYWGFRVFYLDQHVSLQAALKLTLTGRLFTALYFFWIILGLAVVTPVLVAWVAGASRRAVLIAGAAGVAIPALTTATVAFRGAPLNWVETPWTWWLPYLGVYLLGWGLRGVILRGPALVAALIGALAIGAAIAGAFGRSDVPRWFSGLLGGYYSIGVQLFAVLVFLVVQGMVRRGSVLGGLARPRPARLGRLLGEATLGVFALHLAVLFVSYDLPVVGGNAAASTVVELVGRTGLVVVVTFVIVLVLRRIPVVRRVL